VKNVHPPAVGLVGMSSEPSPSFRRESARGASLEKRVRPSVHEKTVRANVK
jgi:hypothetical protein